jgi:hypothetical protein
MRHLQAAAGSCTRQPPGSRGCIQAVQGSTGKGEQRLQREAGMLTWIFSSARSDCSAASGDMKSSGMVTGRLMRIFILGTGAGALSWGGTGGG